MNEAAINALQETLFTNQERVETVDTPSEQPRMEYHPGDWTGRAIDTNESSELDSSRRKSFKNTVKKVQNNMDNIERDISFINNSSYNQTRGDNTTDQRGTVEENQARNSQTENNGHEGSHKFGQYSEQVEQVQDEDEEEKDNESYYNNISKPATFRDTINYEEGQESDIVEVEEIKIKDINQVSSENYTDSNENPFHSDLHTKNQDPVHTPSFRDESNQAEDQNENEENPEKEIMHFSHPKPQTVDSSNIFQGLSRNRSAFQGSNSSGVANSIKQRLPDGLLKEADFERIAKILQRKNFGEQKFFDSDDSSEI